MNKGQHLTLPTAYGIIYSIPWRVDWAGFALCGASQAQLHMLYQEVPAGRIDPPLPATVRLAADVSGLSVWRCNVRGILEERFWAKVEKRGPDECWPWKAGKGRGGYGRIRHGGSGSKTVRAHRVAWELVYGPIPEGMDVLHNCDNPPCCNPGHLYLGTDTDNRQDCLARGRAARGEANGRAKLTEAKVIAIRAARARGETYLSIAQRFGVSDSAIEFIVAGMSWHHVPDGMRSQP